MLMSAARARTFDTYYWLSDPLFTSWLIEHLSPLGTSVCEIGAGTGNLLPALAKHFERVQLIEPCCFMLERLHRRSQSFPHASIVQGCAEGIPLAEKSVDVVVAKSSLHHFDNIPKAITEMYRVARRAVAVIEVISPDDCALEYNRHLLLTKEPGRRLETIFSEQSLVNLIRPHCLELRSLHFDQYIDIRIWLEGSDLTPDACEQLYAYVNSQSGTIRDKMHIHFRNGRLAQLRRMALVLGSLE